MEMMDLGKKASTGPVMAGPMKGPKVYYPELRVEKDLGDYKVGQSVSIMGEAVVTGVRKDQYGESITLEVRKLGCTKKAEANKVGRKLAEDYLNK